MKKNTSQARVNAGKNRPSSQVQTQSAATGPNVHISIKDEAGQSYADFEIPKATADAMVRSVTDQGVSLQRWIEHAVQNKIKTAAPASPSAQSQAPSAAAKTKHYALAITEWNPGNPNRTMTMGELDISREDFEALNRNSIKCGDHVYRGQATFEKLLKMGFEAMRNADPFCELENATWQSNALSILLFENIEYARLEGSNFTDNKDVAGSLTAGLQQLVWETQKRLVNASNMKGAA